MPLSTRAVTIGWLTLLAFAALPGSSATAQAPGSLGGYGAMPGGSSPGMGGGVRVIPFGGTNQVFMPGRTGGGGSPLSFRSRPMMATTRVPFRLGSMSDGMGPSIAPFSRSSSMLGGMRAGGAPRRAMAGSGVMPPSFASPFRDPPSLSPGSAPAMSPGM